MISPLGSERHKHRITITSLGNSLPPDFTLAKSLAGAREVLDCLQSGEPVTVCTLAPCLSPASMQALGALRLFSLRCAVPAAWKMLVTHAGLLSTELAFILVPPKAFPGHAGERLCAEAPLAVLQSPLSVEEGWSCSGCYLPRCNGLCNELGSPGQLPPRAGTAARFPSASSWRAGIAACFPPGDLTAQGDPEKQPLGATVT